MSEPPIRVGHTDEGFAGNTCGCCDGIAASTPVATPNRPGLSAIAFRSGEHGRFKASMLAGLSGAGALPLAGLGTRDDDDFSIALIDAWAATCDVLTFYQERLVNEAYVGTALERFSVGELARLIGYRLHPGAAAETDLVLLMDDPPGAAPDVTDLTVPAGTRVQSQPAPGETAQIFETIEEIESRVAWNALRSRQFRPELPGGDAKGTWIAGSPVLSPGDLLLFLGPDRLGNPDATDWAVRRVISAEPADDGARTYLTWDSPLDSVDGDGLRLFHLPERASLFGYNAPSPKVLSDDQLENFAGDYSTEGGAIDDLVFAISGIVSGLADGDGIPKEWIFGKTTGDTLPLDALYKTYRADGWVVLTNGDGAILPARITSATDDGLSLYAISGKSTVLEVDAADHVDDFTDQWRSVLVHGGSRELTFTDAPILKRVEGAGIELDTLAAELPEDRKLVVRGRRARVRLVSGPQTLDADDGTSRELRTGAELTLMSPPVQSQDTLWRLRDSDGFEGTLTGTAMTMTEVPALEDDEVVAELVTLDRVEPVDPLHSRLLLSEALTMSYDRASLAVHANVARAAHGQGVTEILGAGDPSVPFQKFPLGQSPVTQRLAATETGIASTLTVRVDGVAWDQVPDLYDRGAQAQVYRTVLSDEGETQVEFGEGISGARPTPGRDNIVARFSVGLGLAGNLAAGQLSMPLDRPLGLRETLQPLPATGGDDAETMAGARRNAPNSTLTLGRVVSITDYRDFALGFPGFEKAEARWVWQGETRRILVTVAGPDGAKIPPGSATRDALLAAYRKLGDPLVGFDLISYQPATFRLGLRVAVDPAHQTETVLAGVEAALRQAFSFQVRDFAQKVALSEIAETAHAVAGVLAIDVDLLARTAPPQTQAKAYELLVSRPGRRDPDGSLRSAEILTLDPGPLDKLEVMG